MRKVISQGFVLEFVSIVTLIVTVSLAWVGNLFKLPSEAVISASVGLAVGAYIWALKWELRKELQERIDLYALLGKIEDDELYKRGQSAIENCRLELENLAKGILHIETGQLFQYLIEYSSNAKSRIQATHVGLDEKYLDIWQTGGEQQWHKHTMELVRRGIKFERIFILSRKAFDSENFKSKAIELLKKQQSDGIIVRLAWQEELENPELVQDFGVFDEDLVLVTNPSWTEGYNQVVIHRRPFEINRYLELYKSLQSKSQDVTELNLN